MTTQPSAPVSAPHFHYEQGVLHAENVPVAALAEAYGTPLYVYSRAALQANWNNYAEAIEGRDALVCFGVKANSNLAVLGEFARNGAGFDIVSAGELYRVLQAGGDASRVVFSGVGKQDDEMEAALRAGILCFNVESEAELHRLDEVAGRIGLKAPVSLRVNPDVDPKTHPYISTGLKESKFGIPIANAPAIYATARSLPNLNVIGVDCHIGSQITQLSPYIDALDKLIGLLRHLAETGPAIRHLDLGGGLGIRYADETPILPRQLLDAVYARLSEQGFGTDALPLPRIVLEPGRSLVGNAGILVTRVQYLKPGEPRSYAVVDAAMNDLLRPTLYDAWHSLVAVAPRNDDTPVRAYDIVGPICESGDWLARDRNLPLAQGDLLAIESAGAYGMVMASQYNTRPRAAEVIVDGDRHYLVRQRETLEDLLRGESLLPA